jgi:hypothetical protein
MSNITTDFLHELKKIRSDVRAMASELRDLRNDVKTLCKPEASSDEQDIGDNKQNIAGAPSRSNRDSQSYEKKQYALDKLRYRLERDSSKVALSTFVALVIYTGFTIAMYHANKQSADAASRAADAATKQAATSEQQLELAERPWISADISLAGPLVFDFNGMHAGFQVVFKNSGHSPAFIMIRSDMTVQPNGIDLTKKRDEFCQATEVLGQNNAILNDVVFPGVDIPRTYNLNVTKDELDKAQRFIVDNYPGSGQILTSVQPVVIFCIAYRPSFKSEGHYMTSYILTITQPRPGFPNVTVNLSTKKPIYQPRELRLQFFPVGSITAK